MQTFLPLPDSTASAHVLDRLRLGNQRLEGKSDLYICCRWKGIDLREILALSDKQAEYVWRRYRNHPAAQMWRGRELALAAYCVAVCDEWIARGYVDNQRPLILAAIDALPQCSRELPHWFGDSDFHRSHRSNLLRKSPEHYRQYWPDERDDLPYIWPRPAEG